MFYKWCKFQGNVNQIDVFFIWRKDFYQFLQINSSVFSLTVPVCEAGHDNVLDCLDVITVSLCFLKRHHEKKNLILPPKKQHLKTLMLHLTSLFIVEV